MLVFASMFAYQVGALEKPSHRVGFALLTAASIAGFLMVHAQNAHALVKVTLAIIAIVGALWGMGYIFVKP